ncbi:MAG: hypothetical protein ABL879_10170 [Devosia sp.]
MVSLRAGRLLRAGMALGANNVGTVIVQLLTVPALIHAWQPGLYGEWLLLSTVLGYLAMSDLGLTSVAHNRIDAACARGDTAAASRSFLASLIILGVAVGGVLLIVVVAAALFGATMWDALPAMPAGEARLTLGLLLVDGVLLVGYSHVVNLLRSVQRVAELTTWQSAFRLSGMLAVPAVALLGGRPWAAALASLLVHAAFFFALVVRLRGKVTWLRLLGTMFDRSEAKTLARLMATFALLPASTALYLQGALIVVGALLGPVAVALYSTMRTFTRLITQFVPIAGSAMWSELAHANASGDRVGVARMARLLLWVTPAVVFGLVAVYAIGGETFYQAWTGKKFTFDHWLFVWLIAQASVLALATTLEVLILSVNQHARYAVLYLLTTAAGLVLGYMLVPAVGLAGVPAGGTVAALVPLAYCVVYALRAAGARSR